MLEFDLNPGTLFRHQYPSNKTQVNVFCSHSIATTRTTLNSECGASEIPSTYYNSIFFLKNLLDHATLSYKPTLVSAPQTGHRAPS